MSKLTEKLRKAIAEADSQNEIAKATGLQQSMLNRFASGEQKTLSLDAACLIAAFLGFDLALTPQKRKSKK